MTPRADLRLTVVELRDWLHHQPSNALVKLNVSGNVADCEGHCLGHDAQDATQPVVVLTGGADGEGAVEEDIQVAGHPATLHAFAYVEVEGVAGPVQLPLEVEVGWQGPRLKIDVGPALAAVHEANDETGVDP